MTAAECPSSCERPVVRPATAEDRHALAAMLSELSPQSSFERFFTGGFRVTDKALDALLCAGGNGRAFVAVERQRIIAHAMWATSGSEPRTAELGVVVAADRRRQGLAIRLTHLAVADATDRGMVTAEATVLIGNHASDRLVRRLLPHAMRTSSHAEITYRASLAKRCTPSRTIVGWALSRRRGASATPVDGYQAATLSAMIDSLKLTVQDVP